MNTSEMGFVHTERVESSLFVPRVEALRECGQFIFRQSSRVSSGGDIMPLQDWCALLFVIQVREMKDCRVVTAEWKEVTVD